MAPHSRKKAATATATATAPLQQRSSKASTTIMGAPPPSPSPTTLVPPSRVHSHSYHYPLLLRRVGSSSSADNVGAAACNALLSWFDSVAATRRMPWRKAWVEAGEFEGSGEELRRVLERRGYEVWVSEVMLQQTRVSTVIPYFNKWMDKWPTVEDLAAAKHDEVLAAWKGLGYYSRATRLHQGAKKLTCAPSAAGTIPRGAAALQEVPGIGRYTAGAVSSIAFGEAEAVIDGNVARVLSRQLGLYMDVKDKKATEVLWDVADQLVKFAADYPAVQTSAVPGRWNQALMELGSTVCTPRPRCNECPIQATCRAYGEGKAAAEKRQAPTVVADIEDACTLCAPMDTEDLATTIPQDATTDDPPRASKKRKAASAAAAAKQNNTISHYFAVGTPTSNADTQTDLESANSQESKKRKTPESTAELKPILSYCSLFPKKVAKKKAAEEDCTVCMVELCLSDGSSKWLIEQRPSKGLLASLWQFPQSPLPASQNRPQQRKTSAQQYMSGLDTGGIDMSKARHVAALPPLVHVFTHLKLTMHAHRFRIDADDVPDVELACKGPPTRKWVDSASMDDETLSTGMRKCWELVLKEY